MTALAALWTRSAGLEPESGMHRMLDVQAIYGNRPVVGAVDGGLALGSVPYGEADARPRRICGGRMWFIADLRLDHREALIRALGKDAATPDLTDADLAARAFERWGTGSFDRLRGDFAIIVRDMETGRMTLARDAFGMRPLYFAVQGTTVAVASMAKGLNALPCLPGKPDLDFMEAAIRRFSMVNDGTFWLGVRRVLPGHFTTLDPDGTVRHHLYWDPELPRVRLRDRDAWAEALGERIDRAVASRLSGVDHVATHLSAGLDSSAVTASAAGLLARREGHVTAFTAAPRVGYDPGRAGILTDESAAAAETAALHPNIDHVIWRPRSEWTVNAIDRAFHLSDSPSANICNLTWIHGINDMIKARGLGVLLTGGYGNLAMSQNGQGQAISALAQGDYFGFLGALWALRGLGSARVRRVARNALTMFGPAPLRRRLQHGSMTPGRNDPDTGMMAGHGRSGLVLATVMRVDLGPINKGHLGGWGIDTRDPTTDRDLVEFALAVPARMNIADGTARAVIRATLRGRMSETARLRPGQGLQAADWHEGAAANMGWMREQIDAMRDHDDVRRVVDTDRLSALLDTWPENDWHSPENRSAYRSALLRGISIGHFIRRASGSNR